MTRKASPAAWANKITRYADSDPRALTANPANFRTHPTNQQAALSGALTELGWIAPVIVNELSGNIVDGHARVELAISRGEPTVPVAYVQLSEHDERLALATFDPLGALAGQDDAMLTALLADLSVQDEGLSEMLRDLAPDVPKVLHEDDVDLTPPAEPITRTGDLWLLGSHRLLCGDSTDPAVLARLLDGEQPVLLHMDPPYGINIVTPKEGLTSADLTGGSKPFGATSGITRRSSTGFDRAAPRRGTGLDGPTSRNQIIQSNVYPVMHGDDAPFDPTPWLELAPVVIMWGANYYADRLPISACWICWDKREDITRNNFADCELAWCSKPGPARLFHHLWNGLHKGSQYGERRTHPTEKPVALYEEIGRMFAPEGLWLDPYLGSGAQLVAAQGLGVRLFASEIEPAYVDVAVRRWENLTGGKAVRDGKAVEIHA